jgi:hypothetical protein
VRETWTRRVPGLAAAVVVLLTTAGCAGIRVSTTTTTQTTSTLPFPPVITHGPVTEAAACDLRPGIALNRCRASYTSCASAAKSEVTAYYNGNAPGLDTLAEGYAKSNYGLLENEWRPSYRGCVAALRAEFRRLYGD